MALAKVREISRLAVEDIGITPDGTYWSFPENILAFAYAQTFTRLISITSPTAVWYVRMAKSQSTLIFWQGEVSESVYHDMLAVLKDCGINRLKFLTQKDGTVADILSCTSAVCWYSHSSWQQADFKAGHRWQIKSALERFSFQLLSRDEDGVQIGLDILRKWAIAARPRHFMLTTGHYIAVIKSYPYLPHTILFACRNSEGNFCGLVGGFIYPELGVSVCVEAKHDYSDKFLSLAIWAYWLDYVHNQQAVKLNCNGETADELKKRFRMDPVRHYRPRTVLL